MEITTKEIRQKLIDENQEKFLEMAKELRAKGKSDREIQGVISTFINTKIKQYYTQSHGFSSLHDIMANVELRKDSNAEGIFYEMLRDAGISFSFQYKIGPYRVDYLVNDNLIIELDGPSHKHTKEYDDRRDAYMIEKGYHIIRLPLHLIALDPRAAIEAIKDFSTK